MKNFKNLLNGIIFKIFIAFLIISFAFFGVSSFLLGSSTSWVAKVDGKKIPYNTLKKSMENDRSILLRSNPNNQRAIDYVNSVQFSVDVLRKLINQEITSRISDKYGINGDKKLILESVAKDPTFIKDGKFDRQYFRYFLSQNGFDEQSYIKLIQDEIVNAMVVNSISLTSPVDSEISKKVADLKKEQRIADIVIVSKNNILNKISKPQDEELQALYQENKDNFIIPQTRKTSYLTFSKNQILGKITIEETEIEEYYKSNKNLYSQEEKRDFYHILFKDEKSAEKFLKSLENSKNKIQKFIQLAKEEKKDLNAIKFNNVSKKDMLKNLSDEAFSLKQNENSQVIKSDLGYHIFLAKEVKKNQYIPYQEVKNDIKKQLLAKKTEQILENKISSIEGFLLSSNSLVETAKKFNLGIVKNLSFIDENYKNHLENYTQNAFKLKENQTSSIFISNDKFYAIQVDKINESRSKEFKEVKNEIVKIYNQKQISLKLKELTQKVADEIHQNPGKAIEIALKNGLKFQAEKKFTHSNLVELQGKKIPFSTKFQEELFEIDLNQATSFHNVENGEFQIAVLRKIISNQATEKEIMDYKKQLATIYQNEFIEEFNNYLQNEFKIEVNKSFLKNLQENQ